MFDSSFINTEDYIFGEIFEEQYNLPPNIFFCKTDYIWNFLLKCKNIDAVLFFKKYPYKCNYFWYE